MGFSPAWAGFSPRLDSVLDLVLDRVLSKVGFGYRKGTVQIPNNGFCPSCLLEKD